MGERAGGLFSEAVATAMRRERYGVGGASRIFCICWTVEGNSFVNFRNFIYLFFPETQYKHGARCRAKAGLPGKPREDSESISVAERFMENI